MYTVQTPGERVQLFIQAKAFRDQGGGRDTQGGSWGGWFSETRGDGVETDKVGGSIYRDIAI